VSRLRKSASFPVSTDFFLLSDEIEPLSDPRNLGQGEPQGRKSALLEALRKTADRYSRTGDLGAIVLLSDGIEVLSDVSPAEDADRTMVKNIGVPVSTILVGGLESLKDLSITGINSPGYAFLGEPLELKADVSARGYEGKDVEMSLLYQGSIVQRKTEKVQGERAEVRFSLTPQRTGLLIYKMTAEIPGNQETVVENNHRYFIVKSLRNKLRILHVSGRPSWDQRFLRQILKEMPEVDLISFYVLRTPTNLGSEGADLSLIPFPASQLFAMHLQEFDIIILQNFNPKPYGVDPHLEKLAEHIRSGAGLVVIGGDQAFTAGGLAGSPIEKVLPVKLVPPTDDPSRLWMADEFRPKPTPAGLRHPITRLAPDAVSTSALWASLPPLSGTSVVAGPADDAIPLAIHPLLGGEGGPMPVITVGKAGNGRTMAITADSLWRWQFEGFLSGREGGTLARFWKTAIRWLSADPSLERLRVSVLPDEAAPREELFLDVETLDQTYAPAPGVPVDLSIQSFDSGYQEATKVITDADGHYRQRLRFDGEGTYRVQARLDSVEDPTQCETEFLIRNKDTELYDLSPRPHFMEKIALESRGTYAADSWPGTKVPIRKAGGGRVVSRRDVYLWSTPLALILFLVFLTGEWILRRYGGVF